MREEDKELSCPNCQTLNYVSVAVSDQVADNAEELVLCFKCSETITTIRCFAVFTAATAKQARAMLEAFPR